MIKFIILCVLLIVVTIFAILAIKKEEHATSRLLSGIQGLLIFLIIIVYQHMSNPSITPMDVYQGKTTLEYTIIDGVKTDSTVVWKNEFKPK